MKYGQFLSPANAMYRSLPIGIDGVSRTPFSIGMPVRRQNEADSGFVFSATGETATAFLVSAAAVRQNLALVYVAIPLSGGTALV